MYNFGLQSIRLCSGAGNGKTSACWMTALSVYADKAWGDQPECVARTIRAFAIMLNDAMPDDATRGRLIGPALFAPIGTARLGENGKYFEPSDVADKRRMIAIRYAFHKAVPTVLRAMGLEEQASALETVKLESMEDRSHARDIARKVRAEILALRDRIPYAAAAYAARQAATYTAARQAAAYAAAAYAARQAATAARQAARQAAYAADAARQAASAPARSGSVGGGVGTHEEIRAKLLAARERVFELGVECVLEMCAVDSSVPVEPDLSAVKRVERVVCHS